ncbi:MAG TPA: hypothetical protein VEW65_11935 [Chryseolinea sp.]|nr:hypothetical protein [Chryseolinea sp.]
MKNFVALNRKSAAVIFMIIACNNTVVFGEMMNGYEKDILSMRQSLKHLTVLMQEKTLTSDQRKKLRSTIAVVLDNISYHELTENLLKQFKVMAPDLYEEISAITDSNGRAVNVYVKFIPKDATNVKAWGTTYIDRAKNDNNTYVSEYGENSVSVKIWLVNKALLVLSHELGHVKYQVPNLATYLDYYRKHYDRSDHEDCKGHNPDDPSGKKAMEYEKRFRRNIISFMKLDNHKLVDPVVLQGKIKKNLSTLL